MQRQINADELEMFYHSIGAAVWQIQYLEDVLVTYIVAKQYKLNPTTKKEAYDRLERERKGTLGSLFRKAKQEGIIHDNLESRFDLFLTERNWLIHRSKTESGDDLYNDNLRIAIFSRIILITEEAISLRKIVFEDFQSFLIQQGTDLGKAVKVAISDLRKLSGG